MGIFCLVFGFMNRFYFKFLLQYVYNLELQIDEGIESYCVVFFFQMDDRGFRNVENQIQGLSFKFLVYRLKILWFKEVK